jgi:AcrR family transcriptional regulator
MARVTDEHLQARRNQILDAAWDCFARRGYHQSTMHDVASAAGLSAGAIYRYFASKEAVLKAINERQTERYRELLQGVRSEASGSLDILNVLVEGMMATFADPKFELNARLEVETRPEVLRNSALKDSMAEQLAYMRRELVPLVADARERGHIRKDVDPETLIVLAMCAYEGLRQWALIDPALFRPADLFGLLMTLALNPQDHQEAP